MSWTWYGGLAHTVLEIADSRSVAARHTDVGEGRAVLSTAVCAALVTLHEAVIERICCKSRTVDASRGIVLAAEHPLVAVLRNDTPIVVGAQVGGRGLGSCSGCWTRF